MGVHQGPHVCLSHGRGRRFEPCTAHQENQALSGDAKCFFLARKDFVRTDGFQRPR